MTTELAMRLSGFLFMFILVLNLAMTALGKKIEVDDYDTDAKLRQINDDPNKFYFSILLSLIEHISIVALAITLFIVFSPINMILAIVWTAFRTGEGLFFIYNETNYWGLLNLARQYSETGDPEKESLRDKGQDILQTVTSNYTLALILWSIGTLAYSILFVAYGVLPAIIGWLGIVTSISFGIGNGIKLVVKPGFNILMAIGGLSAMLFEVIIGAWLLFFQT